MTLKVELATEGSLVLGSNQTNFPFKTGGEYGAPFGWDAGQYYGGNNGNESYYNWTTYDDTGITSISPKSATATGAALWQLNYFPLVPGYRYQVGVQCRQMDGKPATIRNLTMERSTNGTTWSFYASVNEGSCLNQWEDLLAQGNAVPANYIYGRIMLFNRSNPGGTVAEWGGQWRQLYVKQMDLTPPPITWTDITCDVQGMEIRHGRERFTNRYDVGTLTLDLVNNDGKYSYHNPHPLNLRPGRQVRVTATYQGVEYPQAFMVLDSIDDTMNLSGLVISRWQCRDATSVLSNQNVSSGYAPAMKSGARIGILLDQVGYAPRALDAGVYAMQNIFAKGSSIRDECGLTADSEGGNFFADRTGQAVYKDRTWQDTDVNLQQVTADLLAMPHEDGPMPPVDDVPTMADAPIICTREFVTDWSMARVVNIVSLANVGGTAREYLDTDSIKANGPATYQRHDFVLFDDYNLDNRAADIMTGFSDPVVRVNSITFAPGLADAWKWTLGSFLNWLVRIWYNHPTEKWGYAVCLHVQSVIHRISLHDWETMLTVDLPQSFVELDFASNYGWDQGLWDEAVWDQGEDEHGALWSSGYVWGKTNPNGYMNPSVGILSTPNTSDLVIGTKRFSITAKVTNAVAVGSVDQFITAQWNPNDWFWAVRTTGVVFGAYNTAGARLDYTVCSVAELAPFMPVGSTRLLRLDFTPDFNGTNAQSILSVSSDDGQTWQVVKTVATQGRIQIRDPAGAPLTVGSHLTSGSSKWMGLIYWCQFQWLDAAGTATGTAWKFDGNDYPGTGTSFTDPRGRTWTMTVAGAVSGPKKLAKWGA